MEEKEKKGRRIFFLVYIHTQNLCIRVYIYKTYICVRLKRGRKRKETEIKKKKDKNRHRETFDFGKSLAS